MNNIYSPLTEVRKNLRINWYRCPIDPKTFRELMRPSDFQGFIQAGGHLFIFLITGGLTLDLATEKLWLEFLVFLFLHGTSASFLKVSPRTNWDMEPFSKQKR